MDLAERVSTLRRLNGLSARQLGSLVGVASTTINRIEAGKVSPAFDLAQEIMTVLGEPIGALASADRDAIAAARLAVDPDAAIGATTGVQRWRERWARLGLVDPEGSVVPGREPDLLFRAATVARLARRSHAVDCLPTTDWRTVARTLSEGDVEYALTGDAAANEYRPSAGESWPVFYVDDLDMAIDVGDLRPRPPGTFGRRITLIEFDGVCEIGRRRLGDVVAANRDQVVIDCFGGTGHMAEQAEALMTVETL